MPGLLNAVGREVASDADLQKLLQLPTQLSNVLSAKTPLNSQALEQAGGMAVSAINFLKDVKRGDVTYKALGKFILCAGGVVAAIPFPPFTQVAGGVIAGFGALLALYGPRRPIFKSDEDEKLEKLQEGMSKIGIETTKQFELALEQADFISAKYNCPYTLTKFWNEDNTKTAVDVSELPSLYAQLFEYASFVSGKGKGMKFIPPNQRLIDNAIELNKYAYGDLSPETFRIYAEKAYTQAKCGATENTENFLLHQLAVFQMARMQLFGLASTAYLFHNEAYVDRLLQLLNEQMGNVQDQGVSKPAGQVTFNSLRTIIKEGRVRHAATLERLSSRVQQVMAQNKQAHQNVQGNFRALVGQAQGQELKAQNQNLKAQLAQRA